MDIATLPAADGADTFCEGALLLPVRGVRGGEAYSVQDWVAEEVPVALEFNGISHAVMLATPLDLEDFALGFSLGEGILDHAHELYAVETASSELGITVRLQVSSGAYPLYARHPGTAESAVTATVFHPAAQTVHHAGATLTPPLRVVGAASSPAPLEARA